MEAAVVDKLVKLIEESFTTEVDGKTYSARDLKKVYNDPRPSPLGSTTLQGLVDYLKSNPEGVDQTKLFIKVNSYGKINLLERFSGENHVRTHLFTSELDGQLETFKFGQFHNTEEFIIKLRALFQHTPDLDTIVAIASKVTTQAAIELADDGLSQTVAVKKGASGALTEKTVTNGVYNLKPYRTFREVDQVESPFILRLKANDNVPQFALFDASGEIWRDLAVHRVAEFVQNSLMGSGIPVIL